MIFFRRHKLLRDIDAHSIIWQTPADTAARLAIVATDDDIGKCVRQVDTNTYWVVRTATPLVFDELTGGTGGGGAVSSVFARVGDVVATLADYTASLISNDSGVAGGTVAGALDTLAALLGSHNHDAAYAPVSHLGGNQHIDWSAAGAEQVDGSRYTAGGAHASTHNDGGVDELNHDNLAGFVAAEHIDWSSAGAEQVDASRYTSGTGGGVTNTVTGQNGVTNTGDNTNAVLEPTYGSTANTVTEGDDPRLSDTRDPNPHSHVIADTTGLQTALDNAGQPVSVEDAGTPLTASVTKLNFAGTGVVVTEPVADEVTITIDATAGSLDIQEEGSTVPNGPHTILDFIGGGVTAADAGGGRATVTIAPGAAPIDTVFGRTGTILPVVGDYDASEVGNDSGVAGVAVSDALDTLDADKAGTAALIGDNALVRGDGGANGIQGSGSTLSDVGDLGIENDITAGNDITAANDLVAQNALTVAGNASLNGGATVDGGDLAINDANVVFTGTLGGLVDGVDVSALSGDVATNTAKVSYTDAAIVAANAVHAAGDGSDHVDVAANSIHAAGDGSDHADVAANTAAIAALGAYPDATGQPATKVAQTDGANGWTFIDTPSGTGSNNLSDLNASSGTVADLNTAISDANARVPAVYIQATRPGAMLDGDFWIES